MGFTGRVEVWDGLVATAAGGTDLVRLVRALDDDVEVWHTLKLGGFLEPWATWDDGAAVFDGLPSVAVYGGTTTFGAEGTALTQLHVAKDRWRALVVGEVRDEAPDVEALVHTTHLGGGRARSRSRPDACRGRTPSECAIPSR